MTTAFNIDQAKFSVGEVIQHRLLGYRGVVVDVDATFQSSDEMYDAMGQEARPPRNRPWYHVLVDGERFVDYVAELNVTADDSDQPVMHPMLGEFFSGYEDGHYVWHDRLN